MEKVYAMVLGQPGAGAIHMSTDPTLRRMEKVAFIGGGNMASALIGGLLKAGRASESIVVVEPVDAQAQKLVVAFCIE